MISKVNRKKISVVMVGIFLFCLPILLYAQAIGPTQQQNTGIVYDCANEHGNLSSAPGECTFQDLINAVNKVVTFGRDIALELSVIVLAIAGFKYMTSGGNASKRAEANQMLLKVVYGIIFIIAAWLIVNLITNTLLGKSLDTILQL